MPSLLHYLERKRHTKGTKEVTTLKWLQSGQPASKAISQGLQGWEGEVLTMPQL